MGSFAWGKLGFYALGAQNLSHWTTREVPEDVLTYSSISFIFILDVPWWLFFKGEGRLVPISSWAEVQPYGRGQVFLLWTLPCLLLCGHRLCIFRAGEGHGRNVPTSRSWPPGGSQAPCKLISPLELPPLLFALLALEGFSHKSWPLKNVLSS